ncbi:MAG: cupin domain-containing protein [Bacteroidia bacterium]|nr:cupin domain-containing protein [Bacteroidia bacterium]
MQKSAAYWIEKLQLTEHVEGGAFKETYRSKQTMAKAHLPTTFHGDRSYSTAIYFLLKQGQFSALHRIASDELWHFYQGGPLEIIEIKPSGALFMHALGPDAEAGETFQCVIEGGSWFGSRVKNGGEYALVGCTVAPGFDFADFELADRDQLVNLFPQHADIIRSLTR